MYLYEFWDPELRSKRTSTLYATLELIGSGLGQAIGGSALKVDVKDLRDGGIYVPEEARQA